MGYNVKIGLQYYWRKIFMKANANTDNEVKKTRIDADSEIYNKNRSDKLEDGQFKEIFLTEKEYIEVLFEQYDVEIVTPKNKLINALKQGDYIIGINYNPFVLVNVFHYENGMIECFKFTDGDDQFKTRLKLVLEVAIFTQTMSPTYFEDTVKAMSHYDDFIVCRKGQLFDI